MGLYPGLKFSSRIPFRNAPRQFGDIWPKDTLGRTGMIQGADVSLGQRDAALESVPANMHRTNESTAHFSHGRKSPRDHGGSATCRSSIASKDLRHRTAPTKRRPRHRSDSAPALPENSGDNGATPSPGRTGALSLQAAFIARPD